MTFSEALLDWYDVSRRNLPWRSDPRPYRVWISEIMLQQTRVETVLPYFERWMQRFPDVFALAGAEQQEVLNLWEGLGYYSRARNLHRAARVLVADFDGKLPPEVGQLKKLPGIGPYTAGAIASIAFGQPAPLVDGNVRRVLARYFDVDLPVDSSEGKRAVWALAEAAVPRDRPGDYNQALMELGSLVCTPRSPDCESCPISAGCRAYALGLQAVRPVLNPKKKIPHFVVTAGILRQDGRVLIAQRPEDGLLGGMWEFPGGKIEDEEELTACLQRELLEELGVHVNVNTPAGVYRHAYTHFRVTLHAFECCLEPPGQAIRCEGVADFKWVLPEQLGDYPMGKIDRLISARILGGRDG